MAASGMIGHGTTLTKDPSGTPLVITNLLSFNATSMSADVIEITSGDSANNTKEFVPGMIDYGTWEAEVNYGETLYNSIRSLFAAQTSDTWKVVRKDGTHDVCTGFVSAVSETHPDQAKATFTFTIKVTGKPTLTVV